MGAGSRVAFALLAGVLLVGAACSSERERRVEPPTFAGDVQALFNARCAGCHGGSTPAAGFRTSSYLDAIGCAGPSRAPATRAGAGGSSPIARALTDDVHRGVVDERERATIVAGLGAGAPAFRERVHAPSIIDPWSTEFHGARLRRARWAPMLDPAHDEACGRCHDGAPSRPAKVTTAAPGATACTTCHSRPEGVLACGTCHGDGDRAYPPRDTCFFPAVSGDAHRAHVEPSARSPGYPCETCHVPRAADVVTGAHGDGTADVLFDVARAGPSASFDASTRACSVACHQRGGARETPRWSDTDGPLGCNGCHASPPAKHYPGACTTCHAEANADGTALTPGPMHLNGRVDLGDGSGTCAACHGRDGKPWPATGSHDAHRAPTMTTAIDCATCHVVPTQVTDPGHLDGQAAVTFAGRALDRGASPAWTGGSCSDVACHGAKLSLPPGPSVVPAWGDPSGAARACTACHGAPPKQHTPSTSCDRSDCHGGEIARSGAALSITAAGRALHVNGVVDLAK